MTTVQPTPEIAEAPARLIPRSNGRWAGFSHLVMARMKELQREPEVIFWVFVFPLLLALGLGIAFRNRPADVISIAIVSGPRTQRALDLIEGSPQKSIIRPNVLPLPEAVKGFRLGKYDLLVEVDANDKIKYLFDPARPESVFAKAQVDDAVQTAAGRQNPLPTSTAISSEPGSRYIDFLIPGLIGMNVMNAAMWGIGFAIVDMRQRKLLKRFVATPMRRSDFLAALASSRLLLMVAEVGLLLGFGVLVFHMRVLGSVLTILLIGAAGALGFAGIGLLTASRAQKIESVSGLINVVMMPMWIFSGVFFSYERFPATIQPFIKMLPLTALNDALRATILEGSPFAAQSGRLLVLALWGGISFGFALKWFRWT
ncbi:MAG TPA: ABC transporter permease [Terriglobales bacterium]|nr:ABC transporter permease [Terriglobales bacterium]